MGHSIKVTHNVYKRLQRLQGPRESYSRVIERTLSAYESILGIRDGLPASDWRLESLKEEAKACELPPS